MTMHTVVPLLTVVMAMGCNSSAGKPTQTDLSDSARWVAGGNNRFAWQLYQGLQGRPGNLFFSPYSISTALAMTYAGARGRTQEQMAEVLCLPTAGSAAQIAWRGRPALASRGHLGLASGSPDAPVIGKRQGQDGLATEEQGQDALATAGTPQGGEPMSPEDLARAFGEIVKDLNARGGRDTYELRVANALWGQKDYEFLAPFVQLVKDQYSGHLERVDFAKAAEKARRTINAWVEKQTNDKIRDLIGPGVLDRMTRLVLTNAVYFKGDWASPFRKDRTEDGPFTLLDGGTVQVPLMNQEASFGYAETDKLQVLEMPYVGGELSLVILLPGEEAGINELEKTLTAESLSNWLATVRRRQVIVTVPRFQMTHKFDMGAVLQAMGMTDAFSDAADFSGMTGRRDLFLSAVIHQAYVDVNEEGTEAAAATGVVMKVTSMAPGRTPIFRADHPFIFLIRDLRSGSLLFLGRVLDPRGQGK
jgi:serpin B